MRIPSTPEIATSNVQLEAEYIAKLNELRQMRNSQISDVRCKRGEYKQLARRESQSLRQRHRGFKGQTLNIAPAVP